MPVNINGYNLSNASNQLALGASNSRIYGSSYGVKVPLLPAMNGAATGAGAAYNVYPFPVQSVDWNVGWNVFTYMFTAPAAGVYYTSFGGIVGDGNGAAGYNAIIVNGVNKYFSYRDTGGPSCWALHHIEMMLYLAQGDTLAWAMNKAPGPVAGGAGGAYQSNHNTCAIFLIG